MATKRPKRQTNSKSRSRPTARVGGVPAKSWFTQSKLLIFIAVFAVIGVFWLALSKAATDPSNREYPWHNNITATTFWVGENFRGASDGSQVCSAYQENWAELWGPKEDTVSTLKDSTDCSGSPIGGCDGKRGGIVETSNRRTVDCQTEKRTTRSDGLDYFPSWATANKLPRENPFYLDLPYNDIGEGLSGRCNVIPWVNDPGFEGNCNKSNFSYMKNRWVEIVGPNGKTCYGQIQDAGPSDDESNDRLKYKDAPYVFGTSAPSNKSWNSAGMDVSPALNGCLGFRDLDGSDDKVSWRWIEAAKVPEGPWTKVVTTSQANWGGNPGVTAAYINAITPKGGVAPTQPPKINTKPSVSVSSPQASNSPTAPASITLNANANDEDGIKVVDFYQGSTKVGSDSTAPYSITINNVAAGKYSYTAVATDNNASPLTNTSSAISITVNPTKPTNNNQRPTVSLASDQSGTPTAPARIALTATAQDDDGIASVQFYMNGKALGNPVTRSPYTVAATEVPAGTHTFTAIATDRSQDKLTGQSNDLSIKVVSGTTGGNNGGNTGGGSGGDNQAPSKPSNLSAYLSFNWGYKMNVGWKASRDNSGKVKYLVNWTGNKTPIVTNQPYYSFNVNSATPHTVSVQAVDDSDNKSEIATETFTPQCFLIFCWL